MIKSTLMITAALLTAASATSAVKSQSAVEGASRQKAAIERMRHAAPQKAEQLNPEDFGEPITEAPEGANVLYYVTGSTYNLNDNWEFEHRPEAGKVGRVVWGNDGFAYIKNPLMNATYDTYIKGEFEGNDVVFKLPQTLSVEEYNGNYFYNFVQMMTYEGEDDYGYPVFAPVEEGNEWRLKIAGNYMEMTAPSDGTVIIGVTDEYGDWGWSGDYGVKYTAFSSKAVAAPEGLETKTLNLTYGLDGSKVEIGFDGNDVYMKGFSKNFPEAWIKGELSDGKITFPTSQYLGISEEYNYFCYFVAAKTEYVAEEDYYTLVPTESLTFDYDETTSTMTSDGVMTVNTNMGEYIWYLEAMQEPKVAPANENVCYIPANPQIISFTPFDAWFGAGNVAFDIPCLSINDDLLDTDNLYYRLFVEGELFTFYPDEYYYLQEETEDVPYAYADNYDFFADGSFHRVYFYFVDADEVAVQSVYKDGDEEYTSDLVYALGGEVKVAGLVEAVSETWTDLSGRTVQNPGKGLYIKTLKAADGSVKSVKVIK